MSRQFDIITYLLTRTLLSEIAIERLENQMADVTTDQARLDAAVTELGVDFDAIDKEVADLKAKVTSGTPAAQLDFSKLDELVARGKSEVPAEEPAPAPEPTPAPVENPVSDPAPAEAPVVDPAPADTVSDPSTDPVSA